MIPMTDVKRVHDSYPVRVARPFVRVCTDDTVLCELGLIGSGTTPAPGLRRAQRGQRSRTMQAGLRRRRQLESFFWLAVMLPPSGWPTATTRERAATPCAFCVPGRPGETNMYESDIVDIFTTKPRRTVCIRRPV